MQSPPLPPELDPDLADHFARERAFDSAFAWPPAESATEARPRKLLHPWSIDRESALRALVLPAAGDSQLDAALTALWLCAHDDRAITLLRIAPLDVQFTTVCFWCRANVLVSERDALLRLADEIFAAADENKTLPAHQGGTSGNG